MTTIFRVLTLICSIISLFCPKESEAQWIASNKGIATSTIQAMAITGHTILLGMWGDNIYESEDSGATWIKTDSGLPVSNVDVNAFASIDGNVFAGTGWGVFRSTDVGKSWVNKDSGLSDQTVHALIAQGNRLFAGTNKGLFISTDNGETWKFKYIEMNHPNLGIGALAAFGNTVFIASTTSNIFYSTDSGSLWTDISLEGDPIGMRAFALIDTCLFIGTVVGVYGTSDLGKRWSFVGLDGHQGLSDIVQTLLVVGNNLFAATYNAGVFVSTNRGESWMNVSEGLPSKAVNALEVFGTSLFAGMNGQGVWRRPLSEMIQSSTVHAEHNVNSNIEAFPNPLSTRTQIRFTTTEHGRNEIVIVNALGETVERIFDEPMNLGEHFIEWNTTKHENGVYFAIVKTPSGMQRVALSVQH